MKQIVKFNKFEMKLQDNWQYKTLENLEKEVWEEPDFLSHVVKRANELRKIPLDQFKTEDIRLMIGQEIGLKYLVPLAIEVLKVDLFAEGDYYEGDLLQMVLKIPNDFWQTYPDYKKTLNNLIQDRMSEINELNIDVSMLYNGRPKSNN